MGGAEIRKITVEIPAALLSEAQKATGGSVGQTIRAGLELLVAGKAHDRLLQLGGKVHFSRTLEELKADR